MLGIFFNRTLKKYVKYKKRNINVNINFEPNVIDSQIILE